MSTQFNAILSIFHTQTFESRKKFPRNTLRGVAALVLCDFYQSISFIDELLVSKSPTDKYRMVQYCLCWYGTVLPENREVEMKKLCLRLGFVFVIFSKKIKYQNENIKSKYFHESIYIYINGKIVL